jgi:two-component system chemotaxis response regulator CheB
VAIGVSTGGPAALAQMLPKFSGDLGVPLLIVQHMPPVFTQSLALSLDAKCALKVQEAADGMPILPNVALIAPGGKQMKVAAGPEPGRKIVRITNDPPENNCRPSVDYLFRSLAEHYKEQITAVIMTGMGSDGTAGLKFLKSQGAAIIAQDEATCVVYGMPREPTEAGIVDVVAPLSTLATEICRTIK